MNARGAGSYPIRAVARMTGLSLDTLRAWERRYEAVVPKRGARGRAYNTADINRLKQLAMLVERGHPIGTVASLSSGELTRLIQGSDTSRTPRKDISAADSSTVMRALDTYDLATLESALARHTAVLPTRELIFAVVVPLLRELGERWDAGALSPAQEHLVSAVIRSVLGALLRSIGRSDQSPPVVFATPAGERHELCLLCAAVLAADAGYAALYLGPDLPAADIAHAAKASSARSIVLAATTPGVVTRTEVKALARELPNADLWVGGPQAADLVARVGFGRAVDRLEDLLPMVAHRGRRL